MLHLHVIQIWNARLLDFRTVYFVKFAEVALDIDLDSAPKASIIV